MRAFTFLHHPPFSAAPTGELIDVVRCHGAPGEQLSAAFAICAQLAAADVELVASGLSGPSGAIAQSAIALYVVHRWSQAGIGVYQSPSRIVSELLLKDDRPPLRDRYRLGVPDWRRPWRLARYYVPPDVRLHGSATTDLGAAVPKQIWIAIGIPADTTPGIYRGQIEVRSKTSQGLPQQVTIELDVLPIALLEPEQDTFLWFRATLDPRLPQHHVSAATLRAQLQDIFVHGFRSVSLNDSRPEFLQRAIDIAADVGFCRNVVLASHAAAILDRLKLRGLRPVFYVSDEIDRRGPGAIAAHADSWRRVKQHHGQTMVSLMGQGFARRLMDPSDLGGPPDVASYYLPENLEFFRAYAVFPAMRATPAYFHWASHMEKPNVHRVLAGAYLWRSGAAGIAPYCYQHLPRYPNSPFDDFDEWEGAERVDADLPFKDHMTTYPASEGSIPTVQWKGLSAGLFDLRYLTTLAAMLARAAGSNVPAVTLIADEARARMEGALGRIHMTSINIRSADDPEPYRDLDSSDYDRFRRTVADDIVLVQRALDQP